MSFSMQIVRKGRSQCFQVVLLAMTSDSKTKFVSIANSCNCLVLADHRETVLYVNGCMWSESMAHCLVGVCSNEGEVML